MKSVEETRKELFELKLNYDTTGGWVKYDTNSSMYLGCEGTPSTVVDILNIRWEAFNTALDAIEIKLPESCKITTEELNEGYDAGFLKWEILDSIESLNLGIKIK